jgi:hypothetical protein
MVNWENSYSYGSKKEVQILPLLREHFGEGVMKNDDRYAKYDYWDENFNYEVKSRTNKMRAYDTTMITKNKVEGSDKDVILLFNYTDCLAYIKYDEEQFKTYQVQNFSRVLRNKKLINECIASCDERIASVQSKLDNWKPYAGVMGLMAKLYDKDEDKKVFTESPQLDNVKNYENNIKLIKVEKMMWNAFKNNGKKEIFKHILAKYDELMMCIL